MRQALLDRIRTGWQNIATKGAAHLGDRTKYLGLTDILPGTCPYERVRGKQEALSCTPEQAVIFERGHAAEDRLAAAFDSVGIAYVREVELCKEDLSIPIKGHVDFALNPVELRKIGIDIPDDIDAVFLECKSKDEIPTAPENNHHDQVLGQVWLAKENGLKAVGFIYVIDMLKGGMELYGPYFHDSARYVALLSRADYITMGLTIGAPVRAIPGISCGSCAFRNECPTFPPVELPVEIQEHVQEHYNLGKAIRDLTAQRDALKDIITRYIGDDCRFASNGLQINLKTFPEAKTYDGATLAAEISSMQKTLDEVSSLLLTMAFSDTPAVDASNAYNHVNTLLESLPQILKENSGTRSGFQKLEIKGERTARQTKKTASLEKEAA